MEEISQVKAIIFCLTLYVLDFGVVINIVLVNGIQK